MVAKIQYSLRFYSCLDQSFENLSDRHISLYTIIFVGNSKMKQLIRDLLFSEFLSKSDFLIEETEKY
jgi:hypothetical protein